MTSSPTWRLQLVGAPRLTSSDGLERDLDGKPLAVLAYLALESNVTRSRLAGLLWPDRVESAARNNLVQLLRRMKSSFKTSLVLENDPLTLAPNVRVDVHEPVHVEYDAELLERVTFEELDLADWLAVQRERFDARRARLLAQAADAHEASGEFARAEELARRVLDLDALSEGAHRRVMRLAYLQGNVEEARAQYERLRAMLHDTLRTEPMPETLELAKLVERGDVTPNVPAVTADAAPRPRLLVGRSREWTAMEAAWQRGQFIILYGQPGMGKSALAEHFTASKGRVLWLEGRPGDALVPYTAAVRNLRRVLTRIEAPLPLDARRTLSFLLPELAPPGETPASSAAANLQDTIRFVFALGLHDVDVCLFDDIQYVDQASIEVGFDLIGVAFPLGRPGTLPHFVAVHREDGLPAATRAIFERLVTDGQAAWIHVPPLDARETRELLAALDVPEEVAQGLADASHGHPLFVLEGANALRQGSDFSASGVPPKLGQLLGDRLGRLPKVALQVARACAALKRDFTPELVSSVLSAPVLDVASAWSVLEDAGVLRDDRFHHDLVAEAVLTGTPASIRRLLHRGAARALEFEGAPPARVAWHWQEGGQTLQAAPWWSRAGEAARASLRFREAAAHYEAAARAYEASGDAKAFAEWLGRAEAIGMTDDASARQEAVNDVLERAGTPLERARGWHLQSELYASVSEGRRAETAARRGLRALDEQAEHAVVDAGPEEISLRANLLADLGAALWVQERLRDAEDALREAVARLEPLGDRGDLGANLSSLAVILDHQDRHREARGVHERACALLERLGEYGHLAVALRNLSVCLSELGDARAALNALRRVEALRESSSGEDAAFTLVLGLACADVGEYDEAVRYLERVEAFELDPTGWLRDYTRGCLGEVLTFLGAFEQAEAYLERALGACVPDVYRVRLLAARARLAFERGEPSAPHLERARTALGEAPRPLSLGRVRLVEALDADSAFARVAAEEALRVARQHELGGLEIAALSRLASALVRLGRFEEAAACAREAEERLETLEPSDVTRGEVFFTAFEARSGAGERDAWRSLERAERWLDDAASRVPPELRESFRTRPRVHGRMLAARRSGVTSEQ